MVYIDWNVTNWVTVLLMAGLGFAIIGLASGAYKRSKMAA